MQNSDDYWMGETTKKTVVLDWDGTLVYSCRYEELLTATSDFETVPAYTPDAVVDTDLNGGRATTAVILRPGVVDVIDALSKNYELVIWSYGVFDYVKPAIDQIGIGDRLKKILTRESSSNRQMLKDLYSRFGNLECTVIVDDMNSTFGILNPHNTIDIHPWNPFTSHAFEDNELFKLSEIIEDRFQRLKGRNQELISQRQEIITKLQRGRYS